jgi:hypothetical protein
VARDEPTPGRFEKIGSSLRDPGLAIALAVAAATRLYVAVRHPIDYNGYWHVFIARNLSREYAGLAHPPLFLLLLRVADAIHHSRLSYRAIPVLAGLGSVALVYRILRRLGAREAARLGALAMATSTSAILLSAEVQSYSLAVFWILWSLLYYLDLVGANPERIPRRSRVAFSLLVCLALSTEYFAGLYLAAAVLAPILVAVLRPAYGRPFLRSLPKRVAADVLTLLPPAVASVLLYELVAKPWIRPLNHLPEFYFVPGAESAAAFLTRNLWNVFNLFSPVLLWSPRRAAAIVVGFAAGVLFAMTTEKPRDAQADRAMPAGILAILLGGGMVLGILGKYPFGGVMRQQFLLLLFGLLSAFLALDRLLRASRRAAIRGSLVILGLAAVLGSFTLHLVDLRSPGSEAFGAQSRLFHREFPDTKLVQVDQLNLIGFFMSHHEWDWQYVDRDPTNASVERYRLASHDRRLTLIAHRDRWNFDFTDPKVLASLRSALRGGDPACFSVFCVHTNLYKPPERRLPDLDPARVETALHAFAGTQDEAVPKIVFRGNDVYAEFCTEESAR